MLTSGKTLYAGLMIIFLVTMATDKDIVKCVKALKKVGCPSGTSKKKCHTEMTAVCKAHLEYKKHGVNVLDFPDMTPDLNTKVAIFVPDSSNVDQRISKEAHKGRAAEVEKKMRDLFGGTTTVKATGSWASASCNRGVCIDNILIVESYMPKDIWAKHNREMKSYLLKKKKLWGQQSVTVEFEIMGENSLQEGMHFI